MQKIGKKFVENVKKQKFGKKLVENVKIGKNAKIW